jgi:hypothetical protein
MVCDVLPFPKSEWFCKVCKTAMLSVGCSSREKLGLYSRVPSLPAQGHADQLVEGTSCSVTSQ